MAISLANTEFSRLRKRSGLSIAESSEKTGYSVRTIYRWERGDTPAREDAIEYLRSRLPIGLSSRPDFTFIDLFSGIGGFRQAFEAIGGSCVYSSEWDRFCRTTYRHNYGEQHVVAGDIRKVETHEIPEHDVLLAGFRANRFRSRASQRKRH